MRIAVVIFFRNEAHPYESILLFNHLLSLPCFFQPSIFPITFIYSGGRGYAFMLSNASAPSFVEKKAPHFGHLIIVSFDIRAHPKKRTDRIVNAKKMFIHLLMMSPLVE
jgi:hypothetical protein